jgi:hypothetical protein
MTADQDAIATSFAADVTQLVADKLSTVDTGSPGSPVAHLVDQHAIEGLTNGIVEVSVIDDNGDTIGSAPLSVDSEIVGIVGLDVKLIKGITVTVAPGKHAFGPFESVPLAVLVHHSPLEFEGDSAEIVVEAVFADNARMTLTEELGLRLSSLATSTVALEDKKYAVVPYMATSAEGDLVKADWAPSSGAHCAASGRLPHESHLLATQKSLCERNTAKSNVCIH